MIPGICLREKKKKKPAFSRLSGEMIPEPGFLFFSWFCGATTRNPVVGIFEEEKINSTARLH